MITENDIIAALKYPETAREKRLVRAIIALAGIPRAVLKDELASNGWCAEKSGLTLVEWRELFAVLHGYDYKTVYHLERCEDEKEKT